MPRPPNPLTPDELRTLQKYVRYDHRQDALVWNPRDPEDFGTTDPERTADGFNRAKAGQPVRTNSTKGFSITIVGRARRYTENKARAALGAPHVKIVTYARNEISPNSRTVRHPHARGAAALNTNPNGNVHDRDLIRTLFYMDAQKVLCWRKLSRESFERLQPEILKRTPYGDESGNVMFSLRSIRTFNTLRADKPVEVTTAGVVRTFMVLKVSPYILEAAFPGCIIGVTKTKPKQKRPDVPDGFISELMLLRRTGQAGVFWRERDQTIWRKLVLYGFHDSVPDAEGIEKWNVVHTGRRVPQYGALNRSGYFRVGLRVLGECRVMRVLNPQVL